MKDDRESTCYDLLIWEIINLVADVFKFGAKKYSPFGWLHVVDYKWKYFNALLRHLIKWWTGEKVDESGHNHLDHVIANAMILRAREGDIDVEKYYEQTKEVPKHDRG